MPGDLFFRSEPLLFRKSYPGSTVGLPHAPAILRMLQVRGGEFLAGEVNKCLLCRDFRRVQGFGPTIRGMELGNSKPECPELALHELLFLFDSGGRWGFGKGCFTRTQRFLGLIERLW